MTFRIFALPALVLALVPFQSKIERVPKPMQERLKAGGFYKAGCPVPLSGLRLLTVTHRDWEGDVRHGGQLIVNAKAAPALRRVFRRLFRAHFPIRHMTFESVYGVNARSRDVTGSFECRQSVGSPCNGGKPSGRWSNHAYGLAIDINPFENPYVGCGASYDPGAKKYLDRSRHRRGMVTRRVIDAFAKSGWEWGGAWAGATKDYMHFSHNGR